MHGSKIELPADSLKQKSGKEVNQPLWETNGAIALFLQKYYNNSIVKFHKILDKYKTHLNEGEIHYFLGKAFQAIGYKGRAIDAYNKAVSVYEESVPDSISKARINESRLAIKVMQEEKNE